MKTIQQIHLQKNSAMHGVVIALPDYKTRCFFGMLWGKSVFEHIDVATTTYAPTTYFVLLCIGTAIGNVGIWDEKFVNPANLWYDYINYSSEKEKLRCL